MGNNIESTTQRKCENVQCCAHEDLKVFELKKGIFGNGYI